MDSPEQIRRRREILACVKRIVVKLGSSVVTTASGVERERVGRLTAELARLHDQGYQILIVTSGARAAGLARLGLDRLPRTIPEQQAAAAIGQINLMALYEEFFAGFGKHIGQVLLTAADVEDRARYLNAHRTLEHLLRRGIIPVINENDSVAVEELKFGDNDRLSALVTGLVGADLLIILTDVDGLLTADPGSGNKRVIRVVHGSQQMGAPLSTKGNALGTGGMASKLAAAHSAARRGVSTLIANGCTPGILSRVMSGEDAVGTLVLACNSPISNRKHWIAYGMFVRGSLLLDAGAVEALTSRGGSLLPSGMVEVRGSFDAGDCVACLDPMGREFARGLTAYDARDCERIKGLGSARIVEILGYHMGDEVIHRDDFVLLEQLGADPEGKRP